MARLGIDFGTTNTVVVLADRGHYPIVLHRVASAAGDIVEEVYPSLIWIDGSSEAWSYGLEADRRLRRSKDGSGCARVGSLKRRLRSFTEGQTVDLGIGTPLAVEELLTRFLHSVRDSVIRSGMVSERERLECVISWPANCNGAQRHVTRRAFRSAGFDVIGSVNEPTASAIEYADRIARGNRSQARHLKSAIAVFDLGGGTFDTSVVAIDGGDFRVLAAAGIEELGGDDFDQALLGLFLAPLGIGASELSPFQRAALLRHARIEKEGISRDPEKGHLEMVPADHGILGGGIQTGGTLAGKGGKRARPGRPVRVSVAAYYEVLRPMVQRALTEMERVFSARETASAGLGPDHIDAIYLVGGSSRLPLIPTMLRERFPRTKILMSDKPYTSVAMGAAIAAAEKIRVSDIIGRHFGVLRLRDGGRREYFSPIFSSGTRLPRREEPPLEVTVDYNPRHNIGRLQYLECSRLGSDDLPQGEMRRWSEILFPYDPTIPPELAVDPAQVVPAEHLGNTSVVEHYCCDADGVISVRLERRADGRERSFEISRD